MALTNVTSAAAAPRSQRAMQLPLIIGAMLTISLWFAITLGSVSFDGGITYRVILISANAAVLLTPILVRFVRGTFDLFDPILMAIFALLGMFVGRPMSDMLTGNHFEHAYDIGPTYNIALLLVLAADLAFILGYELPVSRVIADRFPRVSTRFDARIATWWALIISVLGCAVYSTFLLSNGGLGFFFKLSAGRTGVKSDVSVLSQTTAYITNAIGLLVPGSSILFMLWLYRRRWIFLALAAIVITPYLFLMFGGGARSGVIGVLFGLPFMWYFYRQKRPSFLTLGICGLLIAFVFSVQRDARAEIGASKGSALNSGIADPVTTVMNLFRSDDDEMFDVIAQIISVTPGWVPYDHLSVVTDIFVRALPRTMFPNKPMEAGAAFFATMEPMRARYSLAGTATSLVGNFYLDSGAVTAILWMFVMGVSLSTSWQYFLANQRSIILMIAFSIVPAIVLTTSRGDLAGMFASTPFGLLPILLLFWLQRIRLVSRPGR